MVVARFQTREGAPAEVTEDLVCSCGTFASAGWCRHAAAVERYRRWRITLDSTAVRPPPTA